LDDKWSLAKTNPPQFEDSTGALMMLPADLALVLDPEFKKYVELYAKDQNAFFADFAKAFSKLLELGVKF
jgi:cytochrome c peroxidase